MWRSSKLSVLLHWVDIFFFLVWFGDGRVYVWFLYRHGVFCSGCSERGEFSVLLSFLEGKGLRL